MQASTFRLCFLTERFRTCPTMASDAAQPGSDVVPQAGTTIDDKYRIERVLGAGGMGVVALAHHIKLGQPVALKFLLPSASRQPQAVARFLREARAAAGIQSEHVARIMDVGALSSGAPYLVMEFLRGHDLAELLKTRKRLGMAQTVDYLLQASEALAEAHALGIVHRDLKPANLFLAMRADGSPLVKVLDFGISKMTDTSGENADPALTATATVLGSPQYMSPEQVRSTRDVDARTDVWAIGAILFECLTGQPPFQADSLGGLFAKILCDEPTPFQRLRPDVDPAFAAVIARCLEKSLERRFATMVDLALALAPFASEMGAISVQRISRVGRRGLMSKSTIGAPPQPPSPVGDATTQVLVPPTPVVPTGTAWGATQQDPARRQVTMKWLAGGVAGLGVLTAITAAVLRLVAPGSLGDGTSESPAAPASFGTPAETVHPVDSPMAPSTQPAPGASASAAAPTPTASSHAPQSAPSVTRAPARPAHRTPAPGASTDCTPPYTILPDGTKYAKPECL